MIYGQNEDTGEIRSLLDVLPPQIQAQLQAVTRDALFEVVSAFATVGLSTGITADLPTAGHLVLTLLMFTGRHFGPLVALPLCLLAGCLLAIAEAAATRSERPLTTDRSRIRGPLGYAGPGSLGGTESALPRR